MIWKGKKGVLSDFEYGIPVGATHNTQNIDLLGLSHTPISKVYKDWSPDFNPVEHFWDAVEREFLIINVQLTSLQQLCDAVTSTWTKIREDCSQHLDELKQFWRQKMVQPDNSNVYLMKWLGSVC